MQYLQQNSVFTLCQSLSILLIGLIGSFILRSLRPRKRAPQASFLRLAK